MKELLHKFENKEPEIIFNWKDPETEAEGWTVINSLRGGAAGGGMPAFDPKAIARRIEDGLKKPYNPMNPGTWGDDQWVQRMKDSYGNAVKDIKAKAK